MKKSKKVDHAKKLDHLTSELGATIKGMTAEEKRRYARRDTKKSASKNGSQKFERFPKRERLKLTDRELKRTISAMIDQVEKRFTVEPFNAVVYRSSDNSITTDFIFGDTPLEPQAPVDRDRFHEIIDFLRNSVTSKDEETDRLLLALDDLTWDSCYYSEIIGFYMGVLMGAAMMGASHDKLKTIGQGIYNHYRWDTA